MNKNYFFLIILIFFNSEVSSDEKKVFIKKSVNEHIITNVDIDNEINFITVLNPKLVNIDKKEINKYAENNLINEKIKISELSKFYEINNSESLSNEMIMRFARRLGIDDLTKFKDYLKKNIGSELTASILIELEQLDKAILSEDPLLLTTTNDRANKFILEHIEKP